MDFYTITTEGRDAPTKSMLYPQKWPLTNQIRTYNKRNVCVIHQMRTQKLSTSINSSCKMCKPSIGPRLVTLHLEYVMCSIWVQKYLNWTDWWCKGTFETKRIYLNGFGVQGPIWEQKSLIWVGLRWKGIF